MTEAVAVVEDVAAADPVALIDPVAPIDIAPVEADPCEIAQHEIAPHEIDLDLVEAYMLTLPQVECPIQYHFGPGICIRERAAPAGALIIGHKHKFHNMSMIVSGVCAVFEDGRMTEIVAPFIFVGQPARKVIYAITDVVWLNILSTDLTNPDDIEAHFVEPSQAFREAKICS